MTFTFYPFSPCVGGFGSRKCILIDSCEYNCNPAYKPFTCYFQPILLILIYFIFGLKGPDLLAWRTGDSANQMDIVPQPEVVPRSPHL